MECCACYAVLCKETNKTYLLKNDIKWTILTNNFQMCRLLSTLSAVVIDFFRMLLECVESEDVNIKISLIGKSIPWTQKLVKALQVNASVSTMSVFFKVGVPVQQNSCSYTAQGSGRRLNLGCSGARRRRWICCTGSGTGLRSRWSI